MYAMRQLSGPMVFMGQSRRTQMLEMHRHQDARFYSQSGMTIIYTLDKQDANRRLSWYSRVEHIREYNRDPLQCRACGKHVKPGDKVVSRPGKRYHHIYHYKCALEKHVI